MSLNPSQFPSNSRAPEALAALLRDDAQFEPPQSAISAARALSARLVSQRAARTPTTVPLLIQIGELFEKTGATVVGWLTQHDLGQHLGQHQGNEARLAFAGLRDDITAGFCADVLDADLIESNLRVRAERTRGQDGVVRLVGEIRLRDFAPARAGILVLDTHARVLACQETDAVGLFRIVIPDNAVEIAFVPQPHQGQALRSSVLPLRARSDA